MFKNVSLSIIIVLFFSVVFIHSTAHAASEQPHAAVTCIPDDDTTASMYNASTLTGTVTFSGTTTGNIYFYCDVINPMDAAQGNPTWNALFLTNKDTGANSLVEARLYRKSRTTGVSALVTSLSSFDNPNVKQDWALLGQALNFNTYSYYIRIRMYRKDTSVNPEFHCVTLGYQLL